MIKYSSNMNITETIKKERVIIREFKSYENSIKDHLKVFIKDFSNVTFENNLLKTMILNNLENAITKVKSNIQDLGALDNVLQILQNQDSISETDANTYNKLFRKSQKDINVVQKFIQQTLDCFENVPFSGPDKSITTIEECKRLFSDETYQNFISNFDKLNNTPNSNNVKKTKKSSSTKNDESNSKIKVNFDYNSSDMLCFFPKKESDNLVISTIQDNYKISFN